jgi:hypothetical protein
MSNTAHGANARRVLTPACVALFASVLAACGGGGGDSPVPPPPPPPPPASATLSINADATSTASSGAAIPLHAVLVNSTATPTWTLNGPGSLSASSGGDVTYTPPDAETFTQATTAAITVQAAGLSSSVSIAVATGGKPGLHWQTVQDVVPPWTAVAFANGHFVAVGMHGAMGSSTDGQHWDWHHRTYDINWASVTWGARGWMAVGYDGTVAASADGVQWTVATALLPGADFNTSVTGLTYGSGLYVVTSYSGTWASSDTVHWTAGTTGITAVTAGGGQFVGVAAANGLALASTDGVNWTETSFFGIGSSVAWANGKFISLSGSYLYASADGVTWPMTATLAAYSDGALLSTGVDFVQPAGTDTSFENGDRIDVNVVATSTDGVAWTYHHRYGVGWPSGAARGAGQMVIVSGDGSIASGVDVDSMETAVPASQGFLRAVDYVHGKYFVMTLSGELLSSTDGHAWSRIALGNAASLRLPYGFQGFALAHDAAGHMVALGGISDNGSFTFVAVHSDDGVNWQQATAPANMSASMVFNDGGRFVALTDSAVYTSADGSTWTFASSIPLLDGQGASGAAHGNGQYVIVGQHGLVASSPDAVNWTVGASLHLPADAATPLDLWRVVFTGDRFVAVGAHGMVATSTDGVAWSVAASATDAELHAIAVSPQGEMVAIGARGVAETSMDGTHWTLRSTPNTEWMTDVVYGNGAFLSVGDDGFMAMSSN